jgi:hypothetical protein
MWLKIISLFNPEAISTQIKHQYIYKNDDAAQPIQFLQVKQTGDSDDLILSFSPLKHDEIRRVFGFVLHSDFPCDADDLRLGIVTIRSSDKQLMSYLINRLVQHHSLFTDHATELAQALSVDLVNAHRQFPPWIKNGSLTRFVNSNQSGLITRVKYTSASQVSPIKALDYERKLTGELSLKITSRAPAFNALSQDLASTGCSIHQETNSFSFSSRPGRYQGIVEFIAKLSDHAETDLDMPINEMMGSQPLTTFIQSTLRAVFSPQYDAERFKVTHSEVLIKSGYDPKSMPEEYIDPIFHVFIDDPVLIPGSSQPFERTEIVKWLEKSPEKINPITGEPGLQVSDLKPDNKHAVKTSEFVGEMVQKAAEATEAAKEDSAQIDRCALM